MILGIEYDASADLWSFMCMLFEMVTGDYLFDPSASDTYSKEDDHLASFTRLMGDPSKEFILSGKRS